MLGVLLIVGHISISSSVSTKADDPPLSLFQSTLFTEVAPEESGVDFKNPLLPDHPMRHLYPFGYACGGVSIGDLDGDGRADIFCVGGPVENGLYLQNANGTFKRVESEANSADTWGTGAALVDIDGDNDLDMYVCNYDSPNQLFINRSEPGKPNFTDEAKAYGLDIRDASVMATFADIDNDGDLDAYIACNRYVSATGLPTESPGSYDPETDSVVMLPKYERYFAAWKKPDGNFEADSYGRDDYLMMNTGPNGQGAMVFKDVGAESGIDGSGHALSATWIDVDDDGLLDLHVANDFEDADRLYKNLGVNGQGVIQFEDVIGNVLPYTSWSSMGADLGDLNGDGLLDLMVADMSATTHFKSKINMGEMGGRRRDILENGWPRQAMRNMVYLNTGRGAFQEGAFLAGLNSSDWTWAVKMADFDHDGRPDVYLTNGMSRNYTDSDVPFSGRERYGRNQWDHYRDQPPLNEQNMAFRNRGDLIFEDASRAWGLNKVGMSYSSAYGDLDADGDLDLVVANLDDTVSIYRNDTSGNWLHVKLQGKNFNSQGIGAVVRVSTQSHGTLVRMSNPWTGWASTNSSDLHFGLGEDTEVPEIEVVWPGNRIQRLGPVKANQTLTIQEPDDFEDPRPNVSPQFVDAEDSLGPAFRHQENTFNDYGLQPLLPGKLSAFGPCMAWGDADGDGRLDVFFGGAAEQAGELWLNRGEGQFAKANVPVFATSSSSEDSAACWFDVEGDGDMDLLVASGSTERREGDTALRNRLYLNGGIDTSGEGLVFEQAPDSSMGWLARSSGTVVAEDFDHDGDADLFIGSRSLPGKYPLTPESHLLINESTKEKIQFSRAPQEMAMGLKNAGLVTGAQWVDVDGDQWEDLVVATEWGPVKLWKNHEGVLKEVTQESGLGVAKGWWNGVQVADVDVDGDSDIIGLNVGLNTKYGEAHCDSPAILYFGDMDGTGQPHLIEAKTKKDNLLPVRGRSCSANAMPMIRQNFGTFRDFASADLDTIYTPDRLEGAERFEADAFESGVWLNTSENGVPAFTFVPFPRIAQISPAYGAAVSDFNGDGRTDIFLAQNHDHREPETGLWRGGVGQMLLGMEDGTFRPSSSMETGIVIQGDATGVRAIDIDEDGDDDLVVTLNNDQVRILLNTAADAKPAE